MSKESSVEVTFRVSEKTLEAFRGKAARQLTVDRETGVLATEDDLVEALMKFYVQNDIVQV